MKGDEFPELPIVENKSALMLPIKSLTQGLQGSLFAASSDETKQVLTGIHLTRNDNTLEFAATDGHRLAVVQTQDEQETEESTNTDEIDDSDEIEDSDNSETTDEIEDSDNSDDFDTSDDFDDSNDIDDIEEIENPENSENPKNPDQAFEITIPARALGELEKILNTTKETESVALYVDEGQVVFELGERHLTSRKLEGGYPNYNQLIPREFSRTMILDRKRLITSLERVAVLSDQKNNLVKFTLDTDDEQVILTVEAKELGNAKESNPAQITGERLEIGFNIKYLMDGLKALPSTDIQFQLNEPTQPVIITPLSGLKMTYLIMPVQIRD
jgi:DNA polymerase-3 subunit beta